MPDGSSVVKKYLQMKEVHKQVGGGEQRTWPREVRWK